MTAYILRRLLWMVPTLIVVSIISFVIIQLPPGDYLSTYVSNMAQMGEKISESEIERLEARYGLNKPVYVQYFNWVWNIIREGDFGFSFQYSMKVREVIGHRIFLTIVVSLASMLFTWTLAFPISIWSAVKQYSLSDYFFTFLGFLGLATPNFLLALILMYLGHVYFGADIGGLFSREYIDAAWSWGKFVNMLGHIWVPMIVVGTAGTAGLIRTMRANMLDELRKPYVVTARAKGLSEFKLLFRYPVRVAINPFISTIGWIFPRLVSGSTITAVVLNLPTTGPVLLSALKMQDMYLAGSFILLLSTMTVIGTLISDILLAVVDPRIRYE